LELARIASAHDLAQFRAFGMFFDGRSRVESDLLGGLDGMRRGVDSLCAQNILIFDGLVKIALARTEAEAGDPGSAVTILDEALATCERTGHRAFEAELHRARGEMLPKLDPANPGPAEEAFLAAIVVAKQQETRSFELRAALSLGRFYHSTARPVEAHEVLAPALEGFSPTSEMPEIAEAQALLAALAETDEVKGAEAHRQRRGRLQVAYGNALIAARGFGAPETIEAFAKARESAYGEKDAPERFAADYGLYAGNYQRGELPQAKVYAEALLRDVEDRPDSPEAGVAHRALGLVRWFAGEYREARDHLDRALALFQPGRDDDLAFRFGQDAGVGASLYLAIVLWPLGELERAVSLVRAAQTRIAGLSHIGTHANENMLAALFELMRGSLSPAALSAFELARMAREHDLPMWQAFGLFLEGVATAEGRSPGHGLTDMRRGVELLREQNVRIFDGLIKIALAEAEARAGDTACALAILDEALKTGERAGNRAFQAELHRVRGEMLLKRDPGNPTPADEAFQAAIAVAKQQGTRTFELRAALALAKFYQSADRPIDGHAVLAPALEGFAPTPEMPEIVEAQTLVAALAESDGVKNAVASRQRRLQLQTRYGQAMMYSRGFASDESKTAFARARTLAAGGGDASEWFDAYYGLFIGSLMRGELSLARETAERFLRDAENEGRMTEASVARRNVGAARLWQSDFIGARTNLTEALRIYDLERDRDAKFRFGADTGAGAAGHLAPASWALGDVERAQSLSEEALARADETSHAPTRAFVYNNIALYHMLRGDPQGARRTATILVDLGQEHGMVLWAALGEVHSNWARAWLGGRERGVKSLREALAAYLGQENNLWCPLFQGRLAELEGNDADGALRRIDEALALASETGERWTDALLHRIRGQIKLKRYPANTAPAEAAFLAAIAAAQAQKARSLELQAALALAKLYEATDRPTEAQAVLAPALEGFAPTPKMSEIAEAQALLKQQL
jgi:predicted ATPase